MCTYHRRTGRIASLMAATLVLAACQGGTKTTADGGRAPLPPPTPAQSLGADQPPVIWLGGILEDVAADHLSLREDSGSVATLQRLAQGATSFYRVSGSAWEKLAPEAQVPSGQRACIETLMDGTNLLAIRVFLGAGCGPI